MQKTVVSRCCFVDQDCFLNCFKENEVTNLVDFIVSVEPGCSSSFSLQVSHEKNLVNPYFLVHRVCWPFDFEDA